MTENLTPSQTRGAADLWPAPTYHVVLRNDGAVHATANVLPTTVVVLATFSSRRDAAAAVAAR